MDKTAFRDVTNVAKVAGDGKRGGKTIEETYRKLTQIEHILARPDSYIGSIECVTQPMAVLNADTSRIETRNISYVPGLYKIFDEILVNAADNRQRHSSMNAVKVTVDPAMNTISVWNNGEGIPIAIHKEHSVYVPELIFGHLLTGSNYDDSEKKTTGGRNGYGAKLTNIYSTEFKVETADSVSGKRFTQVFTNNMSNKTAPSITGYSGESYTCITFKPDLARFKMTRLDDDTTALLSKRVYDLAGVMGSKIAVYLNGARVPIASFTEYVQQYVPTGQQVIYEKVNARWEIALTPADHAFQQVSFVNSICTIFGGTHIDYIANQITNEVASTANKKNKGIDVKPAMVKNHMMLFVNCLVDNPQFGSQCKEMLTTRAADFGSTAELSARFMKEVTSSGIVDKVVAFARYKENNQLIGTTKGKAARFIGLPKLDDANLAGTAKAVDCTLILTEGDSAKSLAISGLSVVGRDYYGVFPLKGKLLNVREASTKQVMANAEIQNIVRIMGLKYGQTYESTKGLRYGHLMIMADQDHDGSHIKGLVINFLHHFWPSLMSMSGFLREFITPIIKCVPTNTAKKAIHTFFTLPEYHAWLEDNGTKGWNIKYYKGLGTSTNAEAKEYFAAIDRHQIDFAMDVPEETGANGNDLIDLAFSKKRADDRKEWLKGFVPGTHVDYDVEAMLISDFIQKEFILFSMADNIRSIPSMIDGFKPSQRKVLFTMFKRNDKGDIKVAQLSGAVSEMSAYHHGEVSLASTIVNMAQDFVGANNVNLLVPSGQFGTRLMGGKDAASARYIYTRLQRITRAIFPPEDDAILDYLEEEGLKIEPNYYVPVIPMVLVNGAEGIGTGWSTFVPNHNPRDVITAVRARINGKPIPALAPWYRGYTGSIVAKSATQYAVAGKASVSEDGASISVTELPIRKWTQDYKQMLVGYVTGDKEKEATTSKGVKKKAAPAAKKAKPTAAKDAKKAPKSAKPKPVAAAVTAADGDAGGDFDDVEEVDDEGDDDYGAEDAEEEDDDDDFDDVPGGRSKKGKAKDKSEVELPPGEPLVKEFTENHTDTSVAFTISVTPICEKLTKPCAGGGPDAISAALKKVFKLETSISTGNMHLFDPSGCIRKYDTSAQIIEEFYGVRIEWYAKRKAHLIQKSTDAVTLLDNKARFIMAVIKGELVISNRKKFDILVELHESGYKGIEDASDTADAEDASQIADVMLSSKVDPTTLSKRYNYLLSMPMYALTLEKVVALRADLAKAEAELHRLKNTTEADMWLADLAHLEAELDQFDAENEKDKAAEQAARTAFSKSRNGVGKGGKASKAGKPKKAASDDDEEYEEVRTKPSKPAASVATKTAAAPVAKHQSVAAVTDRFEALSFTERLAARMNNVTSASAIIAAEAPVAAPPKKTVAATKKSAAQPASAPKRNKSDERATGKVATAPPAASSPLKASPAPKKTKAASKKTAQATVPIPVPAPEASRPARASRAAVSYKAMLEDDDEDEIDADSDGEAEFGDDDSDF